MFDCTLGYYTSTEYIIEQLKRAQPQHVKIFSITKVNEETLKTEGDRLVNIVF